MRSGSKQWTKGNILGHANCIEELADNEWRSSSGKGTWEKTLGNDTVNTKKKRQVLCSDKIKTTDVTCLFLDVSDHTGTTYIWMIIWHRILEMIQYLSTVTG